MRNPATKYSATFERSSFAKMTLHRPNTKDGKPQKKKDESSSGQSPQRLRKQPMATYGAELGSKSEHGLTVRACMPSWAGWRRFSFHTMP